MKQGLPGIGGDKGEAGSAGTDVSVTVFQARYIIEL